MKFVIVFICFWELAVINGITVNRFGHEDRFMCHCKNEQEKCNKLAGNCLSGCARGWFGPGCQYRDLAQLEKSIVSQTMAKSHPRNTVDGNEKSCSRSSQHANPLWKIWLPQNETITELYIISEDGPLKHFKNTMVFIEYVPKSHNNNATYKPQLSRLCYRYDKVPPENASFVIKCDKPFAGNQVRIQLDGNRRLVLCDVRINGGRNLSFDQHTDQSSKLHNSKEYSSGQAVDGDIATCSWTKKDHTAWWRLTFGYTAIIQYIKVTQKTGYTTDVEGRLLTASKEYKHYWEDDGNSQHAVYKEAFGIYITPKTSRSITVCETDLYGDCGKNLCGFDCKTECHCQNMTIWTRIYKNCSTAEMEVDEGRNVNRREDLGQESVCEDGSYGQPCIQYGYCLHNKSCDKTIGRCPDGCQSGYTGNACNMECSNNKYGQGCEKTCSTNCKHGTCNHVSGICDGGCKDGWEGDKCEDKCAPGKYGYQCSEECSVNCKDNKCNHTDGKCERGCKAGFYGSKCQYTCYDGWYGENCLKTCGKNCLAVHSTNKCSNVDGVCPSGCKPGWRTPLCNTVCSNNKYGQECAKSCSTNCKQGTCNHVSGKCDGGCKDGWKGYKCEDECSQYYYGTQCKSRCSPNCKQGICNNVDGRCDIGCKDGWTGVTFEKQCSQYYYGTQCRSSCSRTCKQGTCNHVNGSCDVGCKDGWKGDMCENKCHAGRYGRRCANVCSEHCKRGQQKCHNDDGRCMYGCKPGWIPPLCANECSNTTYGERCSRRCSAQCKRGTCNHIDGKCDGGCKDGWHGEKCSSVCLSGTYGNKCGYTCNKNCKHNLCNYVNGKCNSGCLVGWEGEMCTKECPAGKYGNQCSRECSDHCINGKCNHIYGTCENGCKAGWQGELCNSVCNYGKYGDKCARMCSKNCKSAYVCNYVNGSCVNGCKDGWQGERCGDACEAGKYGYDCQHQCNGSCKGGNEFCNNTDGSCQDGCEAGWRGKQCTEKCADGLYGDRCAHWCNTNCNERRCNHIDGKCEQGCNGGWHGVTCEDKCKNGKWGDRCNNLCGSCSDGTCDPVDGQCRGNCSIGFKFTPMCNQECDDGFYGSNCSETCGSCNNGTDCDKVTGVCPNGCSSGYSGDLCMSVVAKQASAGISIPVGIGAGVFLLLGLCLIVLFVKLGRRKRRVPTDDDIELHHENVNNDSKAGPSVTHAPSQPNKAKVDDDRSKSRVQVSKLLQYVKQNLSNKEKLISEFQTIPYGLKYASEAASLPVNIVKNRYREIYPYDHSRVMLSTIQGKPNSEYVNASYIQGRFRENAYIAAQGPTKESLDDFWRMIWEKDIRTIAILTNLVEEMKVKCIQYWGPQNSETVYGNLTVCNVSEHIFAEYTIRRFKVFYKKDREHDRTVTQFHYTAWPDKGVPRSTSSLVQFWNVVRQADSLKSHTWLVHCSAGVGRTGTFIAMDLLYDEGEDLGTVDIHHCVQTLREQRLNMVQTKEQYKFLHGLAVEMLVFPSKQVHLDAYSALYASLQTVDSQSGKSALLLQYEGLQDEISFMDLVYESCKIPKADDNEDRFAAAKLDTNKSKNRYQNVLPANEFRPFLASNVPGCTNYINAVYVQSYCNLRGYILTQTPMKETAIDCCRLLIEEEVKVIVTFNWKGKGKEDVGEYLPENGTIELGPFTCTKIAETDESNYVLRKHKIVYKTESHETIVYQLMFKNWPTKGVIPSDSHSILNFLQAVEFYNRREAGKAIVVQCLNGAERSGLFVVLMNIIEHLRYESRVSIPHLIRCARVRREQIIPNFEQYKFCHDTLLSYVESNTTYANM